MSAQIPAARVSDLLEPITSQQLAAAASALTKCPAKAFVGELRCSPAPFFGSSEILVLRQLKKILSVRSTQ